ncbi:putative transcriptional regulator, HTH [Escherichia coli]|uniref:Putative transcriptional regulator, HTH n=1 Tax=Escherichia coli TaxID=562 RepID=A0A377CGM5_ECOLX|nr:putative transcriptional regulator, HTH [Escherichia coli]
MVAIGLSDGVLGQRSNADLRHFTRILGIEGLFPRWDDRLLSILLGNTKNNPFLIKQRPYENCGSFMSILNVLSDAILSQKKVNFNYKIKSFGLLSHTDWLMTTDCGISLPPMTVH